MLRKFLPTAQEIHKKAMGVPWGKIERRESVFRMGGLVSLAVLFVAWFFCLLEFRIPSMLRFGIPTLGVLIFLVILRHWLLWNGIKKEVKGEFEKRRGDPVAVKRVLEGFRKDFSRLTGNFKRPLQHPLLDLIVEHQILTTASSIFEVFSEESLDGMVQEYADRVGTTAKEVCRAEPLMWRRGFFQLHDNGISLGPEFRGWLEDAVPLLSSTVVF